MESRGTNDNDREKPPAGRNPWLCLSIPGINYVSPSQETAWDLYHPSVLKEHATNQLVSGCVSTGDMECDPQITHLRAQTMG